MSHQLETIIGYKFKHPELLETALTHTSYANETRPPVKHNERLEFLGDSVLQIVSADYLFHAYADRPEGDLTRIRSSLVSEGALFQFAQEINLGDYLRLGRGEEHCGGHHQSGISHTHPEGCRAGAPLWPGAGGGAYSCAGGGHPQRAGPAL